MDDGGYMFMVSEKVLFSSGSEMVNKAGRNALLQQVVADIKLKPHGRIWVRGHTDSVPVAKASTLKKFPHGNIQLSTARALEVASILTGAGGIPKQDVVVAGFGPHEPLVANDTPEHRKLNRRVEIYVAPVN
jgi:chemotaxis protein MotB